MNKNILIILLITLVAICGIGVGTINAVGVPVNFVQVVGSEILLRDENDMMSCAVITSYKGLKKFESQYSITFDLMSGVYPSKHPNEEDFENSFYIVVFNDEACFIEVKGFKRQLLPSRYYLDIECELVKIRIAMTPEGKKRSGYAIIKVSNKLKITGINVRGCESSGGVTKFF